MGSGKLNTSKISGAVSMKKIFLMFAIGFCLAGNNAFASDNVLQAIQVNGVKDSYNIVLKSDDVSEIKKTIQAPNKMMLTLKGIRASKTINTIYNNTSSVDSVVVEPIGDDGVKILIQAANVSNAEIHFDSLKTPLGLLGNTAQQTKPSEEIVLSGPMESYRPIYNKNDNQDETEISLEGGLSLLKRALKNDKINWMISFGLFAMLIVMGIKLIKGKDNEIKVGLTQSLREREVDLYRGGLNLAPGMNSDMHSNLGNPGLSATGAGYHTPANSPSSVPTQNVSGNYGLRAYQQGTRSSYVSSEIQRPRPTVAPPVSPVNLQKVAQSAGLKPQAQNMMNNATQNMMSSVQTAPQSSNKTKVANIDSMKFLESMTKIYEKNGRADLAQGLKTNMKKAKMNLV